MHAAVAAGRASRHPGRRGGDGQDASATRSCRTRPARRLRRSLRALLRPARPLRRRRRDAQPPPAAHARGWPRERRLAALRQTVCELHAELPRNGLVAWTSGNLSARVPGEDLMVIKPSGLGYDELTPESMVVCDLDGERRRGRPCAVQRRRDARLHLPAAAGGGRRRPHAFDVRDRVGGARGADPLRADRDGRRVRRADPGRPVRADRRRGDRPRRSSKRSPGRAQPRC